MTLVKSKASRIIPWSSRAKLSEFIVIIKPNTKISTIHGKYTTQLYLNGIGIMKSIWMLIFDMKCSRLAFITSSSIAAKTNGMPPKISLIINNQVSSRNIIRLSKSFILIITWSRLSVDKNIASFKAK